VPPNHTWAFPEAESLSETVGTVQEFSVETYESLRSREEQKFFDWSIGILGDAGIAGVLKNDYVYQASTLQGEFILAREDRTRSRCPGLRWISMMVKLLEGLSNSLVL
jgi:hypothetical protein